MKIKATLYEIKLALDHFEYKLKALPTPTPADFNREYETHVAVYNTEKDRLKVMVDGLRKVYESRLELFVEGLLNEV